MSAPTAAVLVFPGTNCELETARALARNGFVAQVLRWNEAGSLSKFDAVVLAGGFSFEDRGRAGLIASRFSALNQVAKLARAGKPVLGICNGAQILVESGLVPLGQIGTAPLALTRNSRVDGTGRVVGTGFYNAWVWVRPGSDTPNAFNQFDHPIQIPAAHAEGRFVSPDGEFLASLVAGGQNAFVYCTESGELDPAFPTNPNGSVLSLAGVTSPAGNVLALMPHPERSTAGDPIFRSMHAWVTGRVDRPVRSRPLPIHTPALRLRPKPDFDLEFFIQLIITDNEALSVQSAAIASGAKVELAKYRWFGIRAGGPQASWLPLADRLIRSGSLANTEKELVFARIGRQIYRFDKNSGWQPAKLDLPTARVLAVESETSLDLALARGLALPELRSGVVWAARSGSTADFDRAVRSGFFHHAAAGELVQI